LLVDTETKLVYDFVLRTKPRHDTLGAKTMVQRLKHKGVLILADKGYDSEPLHEIDAESGNIMYAPTRDFHASHLHDVAEKPRILATKIPTHKMQNL